MPINMASGVDVVSTDPALRNCGLRRAVPAARPPQEIARNLPWHHGTRDLWKLLGSGSSPVCFRLRITPSACDSSLSSLSSTYSVLIGPRNFLRPFHGCTIATTSCSLVLRIVPPDFPPSSLFFAGALGFALAVTAVFPPLLACVAG